MTGPVRSRQQPASCRLGPAPDPAISPARAEHRRRQGPARDFRPATAGAPLPSSRLKKLAMAGRGAKFNRRRIWITAERVHRRASADHCPGPSPAPLTGSLDAGPDPGLPVSVPAARMRPLICWSLVMPCSVSCRLLVLLLTALPSAAGVAAEPVSRLESVVVTARVSSNPPSICQWRSTA